MAGQVISRGFFGKRRTPEESQRVPPGQYLTPDFPVLSAGPTPRIPLSEWSFTSRDWFSPRSNGRGTTSCICQSDPTM